MDVNTLPYLPTNKYELGKYFSPIPHEVIIRIFKAMGLKEFFRFSLTCHSWEYYAGKTGRFERAYNQQFQIAMFTEPKLISAHKAKKDLSQVFLDLMNLTKKSPPLSLENSFQAHLKLTRLGLVTWKAMYQIAQERDKKLPNSQGWNLICAELLAQHKVAEAVHVLQQFIPKTICHHRTIANDIIQYYAQKNQQAIAAEFYKQNKAELLDLWYTCLNGSTDLSSSIISRIIFCNAIDDFVHFLEARLLGGLINKLCQSFFLEKNKMSWSFDFFSRLLKSPLISKETVILFIDSSIDQSTIERLMVTTSFPHFKCDEWAIFSLHLHIKGKSLPTTLETVNKKISVISKECLSEILSSCGSISFETIKIFINKCAFISIDHVKKALIHECSDEILLALLDKVIVVDPSTPDIEIKKVLQLAKGRKNEKIEATLRKYYRGGKKCSVM